jgi:dTDP-4-dehydrorhamnose 3,5-epimerase-like enzyme
MNSTARLPGVRLISLPRHTHENGELIVVQGAQHVPFAIARVFIVSALKGALRGQHAHKACTQFLMCTSGAISVACTDGFDTEVFALEGPGTGLLISPGIWASQTNLKINSVLTVLCDQEYDADDYIRNFDEFKAFKSSKTPTVSGETK